MKYLSYISHFQKELRYLCNDLTNIRPSKPHYQIFYQLFLNFFICYM